MKYELAKKLKEKGFPQEGDMWVCSHGYIKVGVPTAVMCTDEMYYVPTLSELIEACGDAFQNLKHERHADVGSIEIRHQWTAYAYPKYGTALTPEEAVAHLWIALQKNVV